MRTGAIIAAMWVLGACDILDDAVSFTVCSDWQQLLIDSAQLGMPAASSSVPTVPCGSGMPAACDSLACGGARYACETRCGTSNSCELDATVEEKVQIDLRQQLSSKLGQKAVKKATLDRFEYQAAQNTLNIDLPATQLSVASATAESSDDASAVSLASLDPIPAGTVIEPARRVDVSPAGQDALTSFVAGQVPFQLFVRSTLGFRANDPIPTGSIALQARACFKVNPL